MLKRISMMLMAALIVISLFPMESVYAAKKYQVGWLISGPAIELNWTKADGLWVKGGDPIAPDGSTDSWKPSGVPKNGPWTFSVRVKTRYDTRIVVNGSKWSGEPFKYDYENTPASDVEYSGDWFFSGEGRTATVTRYSDKVKGRIVQVNEVYGFPNSNGYYTIEIKVEPEDFNKVQGSIVYFGGFSAFKYISEKEIEPDSGSGGGGGGGGGGGDVDPPDPTDPPDPEYPSRAAVGVSANASGTLVNYKSFNGNVVAEASARDETNYNDYGDLDSIDVSMRAFGNTYNKSSSSQHGTASLSKTGDFTGEMSWMSGSGAQYGYTVSASGSVTLTDGDPKSASGTANANNNIVLTNDAASTSWSLTTNNLNGGAVPNGYYYTNTPTRLSVTYTDPENDIKDVALFIGTKAEMDAGYASLIYKKGSGDQLVNNEINFSETGRVATLNGYSSTVTFKTPGVYSYTAYVNDAKSNPALGNGKQITGTFVVRTDPAPPKAIITSPGYAFETEPFRVTQSSTDPNGVDDILTYTWNGASDVTQEVDPGSIDDPATWKPVAASSSWPGSGGLGGKNGGTITFPTGSSHHSYRISLAVKDATNLNARVEQIIKVISNVPVANITIKDNDGSDTIKENRKITLSSENSLAPNSSPIVWNDCTWTIESVDGTGTANIHEDTNQRNGNKQRVLQFSKPGDYKITLKLSNAFSTANPSHEDIGAATYSTVIHVVEDKVPDSSVSVITAKPNFVDNPIDYTVKFRVTSTSPDGDKIVAPSAYVWTVYEDYNSDGTFTDDEIVPQGKLTFNAEKTEVAMKTKYEQGRHNTIKAVVKTTETFAEPFMPNFLATDGSYIRATTVDTTEVINWVPKVVVNPDQGPNSIPPDAYNPNPGTPYEDTDLDGDGVMDGKFIRAYTDDSFNVHTAITDEFPETAVVTWDIKKKDHSGNYSSMSSDGSSWINSSRVTSTLGHDGGSLRIDSPGIYTLTAVVTDDCGDTGSFTLNARIYTLPQARLETNPAYIYFGADWTTKENIRFDLRSNPTIVDDEWGKAWHTMDWNKDSFDVTPLEGQKANEIHFMTPDYIGRYSDTTPEDLTKFTGRYSPLGFGKVSVQPVDIIVMPGLYGMTSADNADKITDEYRTALYASADKLKAQLEAKDKRYNVQVIKTRAAKETYDYFEEREIYGYFDGFDNHQDDEKNMYKMEYKTTGFGTGSTTIKADLNKMNQDDCKFGYITLQTGYDASRPELGNVQVEFNGTAEVYCNGLLLATCTKQEDWPRVATIARQDDNSWIIAGANGTKVSCRDTVQFEVKFKNGQDGYCLAVAGWAGLIHDKSHDVTHSITVAETLNTVNMRPGATKLLIFATNNTSVTPEFVNGTTGSASYTQMIQVLKDKGIHMMAIVPYNLNTAMVQMYKDLTYNEMTYGEGALFGDPSMEGYITGNVFNYATKLMPMGQNTQYRSCAFTDPGRYEIRYWGTNYGGKVTVPVKYTVKVEPDLPPNILGSVEPTFLRDPNDANRAKILLSGPYSAAIGKDALTIQSVDMDFIDYIKVKVIYDSNNNKLFTDSTDKQWLLPEGSGTLNGLNYVLQKIN